MKKPKILLLFTLFLFLSGCSDAPKPNLNAVVTSTIGYNFSTQTIFWDSVDNGSTYTVEISSPLRTFAATTNQYYYPSTSSFSVRIKANATPNYSESVYSRSVQIVFLTTPTNLKVVDGELIWDPVFGASGYEVLEVISSKTTKVSTNTFSDIPSGIGLNYKVKAIGLANLVKDSDYSAPLSFSILPSPSNLTYNRDTKVISWDPVASASGYKIQINEAIYTQGVDNTTFFYTPSSPIEVIKVYASSIQNNILSSYFSTINLRKLNSIPSSSLTINELDTLETVITFNTVQNASAYNVKVKGIELQNIVQNGSIVEAYHNFTVGDNLVEVKAIAPLSPEVINGVKNYFFDSDVTEFSTNKLVAPTNIRILDGVFVWDSVVNASQYGVSYSGGEEFIVSEPEHKFISPSSNGGNFNIKVRAIGNSKDFISSDFTPQYNFSILPQVNISTITLSNDVLSWQAVQGSTSYTVFVNDTPVNVNSNSINLQTSTANSFTIQIIARGNYVAKTLDSLISSPYSISRLATPLNFSLNINGNLTWTAVPNAFRYVIVLNNEILYSDTTSYDISNKVGPNEQFVVYIYAESNQSSINPRLNSNSTSSLSGRRLPTPSNLRIDNDKIIWDSVPNANAYEIVLNGIMSTIPATQNPSFSPNLLNSNPSNSFTVRAVANTQATSNDFFINSPTTPTFSFSSNKLSTPAINSVRVFSSEDNPYIEVKFSSIANASLYNVNIGGIDYPTTENTFKHYYNNAGIYEIYVTAIGNGLSYVNSSRSSTRTIKILQSTTLSKSFNGSNWILRWTSVNDAQGYRVFKRTINLQTNEVTETTTNLNSTFTQADVFVENGFSYEYQIMVIGDNINSFNSSWSNVIAIS